MKINDLLDSKVKLFLICVVEKNLHEEFKPIKHNNTHIVILFKKFRASSIVRRFIGGGCSSSIECLILFSLCM